MDACSSPPSPVAAATVTGETVAKRPDPELAIEVALPPLSASSVESPEVVRIRRALERSSGHRARAAQMLGMSRVTLWRRMGELGITADR